MTNTLYSERHKALVRFLIEQRKAAGLTQAAVAEGLGRYQSHIANIENGQRRVDVVELLDLAEVIGFDTVQLIGLLSSVKRS